MTYTANLENTRLKFNGTLTTYRYSTDMTFGRTLLGLTYSIEIGRDDVNDVKYASLAVPFKLIVCNLCGRIGFDKYREVMGYIEDRVLPCFKLPGWSLVDGKLYHDFTAEEFVGVLDPANVNETEKLNGGHAVDWDDVRPLLGDNAYLIRYTEVDGPARRLLTYVAKLADMIEKHARKWYANNKE